MYTLTLKDQLKLSILQNRENEDLTSPAGYSKRSAYRKMLRDSAWNSLMLDDVQSA